MITEKKAIAEEGKTTEESPEMTPEQLDALDKACMKGITLRDIEKITGRKPDLDILTFLMTEDNISLNELARYTGKDRRNLYKKLSKFRKLAPYKGGLRACYSPIDIFGCDLDKYRQFLLWRGKKQLSELIEKPVLPVITVKEAIRITKLSSAHLYRLCKDNKLTKTDDQIMISTLKEHLKKHVAKLEREIELTLKAIEELEALRQSSLQMVKNNQCKIAIG